MVSIIIAAHNEGSVIGRTLDCLQSGNLGAQVIVVPNGCTDDTADVARARSWVEVIELEEGGKARALNAGDELARSFPRIYLDADISVPEGGVAALVDALDSSGALAAVPGRDLETTGRPWPVVAHSMIHRRLPVFRDGLFGRGMIAMSAEGRARFDSFPIMVADDLFIDSLFTAEEKTHVEQVKVVVETPFTTRDLIQRLVRVRRGSAAMRKAAAIGSITIPVRAADRWSWLRDVVLKEPRLLPAGIAYAAVTLVAAFKARKGSVDAMDWGRDESTRK